MAEPAQMEIARRGALLHSQLDLVKSQLKHAKKARKDDLAPGIRARLETRIATLSKQRDSLATELQKLG